MKMRSSAQTEPKKLLPNTSRLQEHLKLVHARNSVLEKRAIFAFFVFARKPFLHSIVWNSHRFSAICIFYNLKKKENENSKKLNPPQLSTHRTTRAVRCGPSRFPQRTLLVPRAAAHSWHKLTRPTSLSRSNVQVSAHLVPGPLHHVRPDPLHHGDWLPIFTIPWLPILLCCEVTKHSYLTKEKQTLKKTK